MNADQGDLSRRVNFMFRILLFYICFCGSAWWVTLWVVHRVWHKALAGAGIVRAEWVSVGVVCRCSAAESSYPLTLHVSMAGSVGQHRV